ncbi:peptidyl-tRNA hydrolase domain protein [Penicillium brasilianum]|uniref:Peptidyl-tRNA hydrolase domain protein n=1 Tax=Penicillium brasilianum TaxID=104259 RepID=A0A1S9RLX2_PENBI|nr:peptidyl-tRNA hydrolase domain protein [Penicillium brasilianum]
MPRARWCAFRSWSRTPSSPFLPFTAPFSSGRSAKFASTGSSDPHDPHGLELARRWLTAFESGLKAIPRHVGQVSFSRSSGPGGQNVNKSVQIRSVRTVPPPLSNSVNSKATLKVPLATLFPLVPPLLHPQLRASRYATDRSQALVIQSDESRQQATNVDLCYEKLNRLLVSSAKEVIPGETSQEQKDRVSKL